MIMNEKLVCVLLVQDVWIYLCGGLDVLLWVEVVCLCDVFVGGMYELLCCCVLVVLISGSVLDDLCVVCDFYFDFDIQVVQQDCGVWIDLVNVLVMVFVDGEIIRGVVELLFVVVCDLVYMVIEMGLVYVVELELFEGIINVVFGLLCNVCIFNLGDLNLVVCWGGYLILCDEYLYIKQVGYELGLCGLDICIGCGFGVMKGLMKGVIIVYVKQCCIVMCYIGLIELGIIVVELLNLIVNYLVIMLDIEKCFEVFVCIGYGIIVFVGGVGIVEEILYLFGILLCEENRDLLFLLILIGLMVVVLYFEQIDCFICLILGDVVVECYEIIIGDLVVVVKKMVSGIKCVCEYCLVQKDLFFFNWLIEILWEYQQFFVFIYEVMVVLDLYYGCVLYVLVVDLCCVFLGIVVGNVKEDGMCCIEQFGLFQIYGDLDMMQVLDVLLCVFVEQCWMKIFGEYQFCYQVLV